MLTPSKTRERKKERSIENFSHKSANCHLTLCCLDVVVVVFVVFVVMYI